MKYIKSKINRVIKTLLVVIIISILYTNTSRAQIGVPISTTFDFHNIMNYQKNFTLDRIATLFAKQILHKLTASVVTWINSGFEGSPSFLTNPGAFFLDAADQVTGAFLATNGPLSALCSPFTIDIRLALALSQTSLASQKYECTLGKIIEAQRNGPEIIVNGQVIKSASNASMDGFLKGDFNQGGWPAFVALTTEPNNNPYGAFLSAQGDLQARINRRQNTIQADINLGQGFMSWKDCKDIPGGTIDPNNEYESVEARESAETIAGGDGAVRVKNNKDGTQTYQSCEVKTPGSVIAGTLEKNLNVPVTELELANDINAIVNALVTQMINKMMTAGLGSLSGTSGGGTSYTQQIIDQAEAEGRSVQNQLNGLQENVSMAFDQLDSYLAVYNQADKILSDLEKTITSARSCYSNKSSNESINIKTSLDSKLATIKTLRGEIATGKSALSEKRKKLEDISYSISGSASADTANKQFEQYMEFIRSGSLGGQNDLASAQRYLDQAKEMQKTLEPEANSYLRSCTYAQ